MILKIVLLLLVFIFFPYEYYYVFNNYSIILFLISISIYLLYVKDLPNIIYFVSVIFFVFIGISNYFIIKGVEWAYHKSDIVKNTEIFAYFIFFVELFFLPLRKIKIKKQIFNNSNLSKNGEILVFLILLAALFVYIFHNSNLIINLGLFNKNITESNRFSIQIKYGFLQYFIIILAQYFFLKAIKCRLNSIFIFIMFSISIFLLSLNATRFFSILLIMTTSCVYFLIKEFSIKLKSIIILVGVFVSISLLYFSILEIRYDDRKFEYKNLVNSFSEIKASFGGEFRDGAYALEVFKNPEMYDKLKKNYIATVLIPVIPQMILNQFSVDKKSIQEKVSATLFKKYFNINNSIRISNLTEIYICFGNIGILVASLFISLIQLVIQLYKDQQKNDLYTLIFGFLSYIPFYFILGQSNALLSVFLKFALFVFLLFLTVKIILYQENKNFEIS